MRHPPWTAYHPNGKKRTRRRKYRNAETITVKMNIEHALGHVFHDLVDSNKDLGANEFVSDVYVDRAIDQFVPNADGLHS